MIRLHFKTLERATKYKNQMNNRRKYTYVFGPFGMQPGYFTVVVDTEVMADYGTVGKKNFSPRFFRRLEKEKRFHDIIMV